MTSVPNPTVPASRSSLMALNLSAYLRVLFDAIWSDRSIVFPAFALSLHIRQQDVGLCTAAFSFACLMQLVSLPVLTRIRGRMRFVLGFGLVEPVLVVAAVVTLWGLPVDWRLPGLFVFVALAAGMMHLTRPVTDDWLSQTLPRRIRARYLGRRIQVVSLISIVASIGIGRLVDWIKANFENPSYALGAFIIVGAVFCAVSVLAYARVADPLETKADEFRFADVKTALTYRPFLLFLVSIVVYNLPFFMSVPYYQVYFQKTLNMSAVEVGVAMAGYAAVKIGVMQVWRRILDRMSMRYVLMLIGPAYVLFFGLLGAALPERHWPVFLAWALAGLADGAYGTIIQATSYKIIPQGPVRPAYFALYNMVMLGTYGVGALVAWPILTCLAGFESSFAAHHLTRYQGLYSLMCILMIAGIFVSWWILDGVEHDT